MGLISRFAAQYKGTESGRVLQLRRSNLGRRLKKLEVELTDESGLVPHSAKWRAYWLGSIGCRSS